MKISTLIYEAGLSSTEAKMVERFLKNNNMELSTYVIVNPNSLLKHVDDPGAPKTIFVQAGHRIDQNKINPNKFFFALMNGCSKEYTIIIPDIKRNR